MQMVKKSIGTNVFIYPMPVVLAGTQADNRANFMAVGWIARANLNPPMVAIGLHKSHFTSDLIKKNKTFSIKSTRSGLDRENRLLWAGIWG